MDFRKIYYQPTSCKFAESWRIMITLLVYCILPWNKTHYWNSCWWKDILILTHSMTNLQLRHNFSHRVFWRCFRNSPFQSRGLFEVLILDRIFKLKLQRSKKFFFKKKKEKKSSTRIIISKEKYWVRMLLL